MATTLQNIIKVQPRNNHQKIEIDARNNLTSGKMSTESSRKFTESLCTERPVEKGSYEICGPIDATKTLFDGMSGHDFLQKLPRTINACPFLEHGCHKVGSELEVKQHLRDDRIPHIVQLCRVAFELRKQQETILENHYKVFGKMDSQLHQTHAIFQKFSSQFIFRISDINEAIVQAKMNKQRRLIMSSTFETHRYGYKMLIIIAPFGDVEVSREFTSIFLTLVKSDFDAIQEWPFPHPIKFTALAVNPSNNLEKTFIPNAVPENEAFLGRPKGQRNAAFGIKDFCPLPEIYKYTINNDFFIRIEIDLSRGHRRKPRQVMSSQCQGLYIQ